MPDRAYFAYGSNMIEAQMHERAPAALLVGSARLDNFEFTIASRGYASIVHGLGKVVYGLVWKITRACERSLDRYEGVGWGYYRKTCVTVATADGNHEALVYIAENPARGENRYGARWQKILDSARQHDFPATYLSHLETFK